MKKTAFAAFIAFWSSVATLLTIAALHPVTLATAADNEPIYTLEEIAAHNKQEDCWMTIRGKVYDFTGHISNHPAPPAIIAAWCGKEATEGMSTKGYGRDHSPTAWEMMESYRIGTLTEE